MSTVRDPNTDQQLPTPNDNPPIHDLVAEDLMARKQMGTRKYGTPLQAHNGRNPLRDAYEETLDQAVYLRQSIEEIEDLRERIAVLEPIVREVAFLECDWVRMGFKSCEKAPREQKDWCVYCRADALVSGDGQVPAEGSDA